MLGGRRQTASTYTVVKDRKGPANAGGKDHGGDARWPLEAKEREPGHDGAVPVPDCSIQRP